MGAVVVALGRDPVDLNAWARGAGLHELEFNPCISTEASAFVCLMLLRPWCNLAADACGVAAYESCLFFVGQNPH